MRKTSPKFSKPKVLAAKRGSKAAPLSLTAAVRGTDGKLHFPGAPLFTPSLSPQEVLEAGAFGGGYFRDIHSGVTKKSYTGAWKEFSKTGWFSSLDVPTQVASATYNATVNKYNVCSGLGLLEWESSGWIKPQDPYGWFQWYCRFFLGRRSEDDERQIGRWARVCGERGRWRNNLIAKCVTSGKRFDDATISPVVRQTLLHWAYELTQHDLDKFAALMKKGARASFIPRAKGPREEAAEQAPPPGIKRRRKE